MRLRSIVWKERRVARASRRDKHPQDRNWRNFSRSESSLTAGHRPGRNLESQPPSCRRKLFPPAFPRKAVNWYFDSVHTRIHDFDGGFVMKQARDKNIPCYSCAVMQACKQEAKQETTERSRNWSPWKVVRFTSYPPALSEYRFRERERERERDKEATFSSSRSRVLLFFLGNSNRNIIREQTLNQKKTDEDRDNKVRSLSLFRHPNSSVCLFGSHWLWGHKISFQETYLSLSLFFVLSGDERREPLNSIELNWR